MAESLRYDASPLSDEKWSWVPSYEGTYDVSTYGRVRTYFKSFGRAGRAVVDAPVDFLMPRTNLQGYLSVSLRGNGQNLHAFIHVLVMAAFVGPKPVGCDVLHRDGDPSNNELGNLHYGTRSENTLDAIRHAKNGKLSTKRIAWRVDRVYDRTPRVRLNLLESSTERWKPVIDYEGRHEVSDRGRVRSYVQATRHGQKVRQWAHTMSAGVNGQGYPAVTLIRADGGRWKVPVHRLVLRAFCGDRPARMMARHLNGKKTDNRLANLVYGTARENQLDRNVHGTGNQGERCGTHRLCEDEVRLMRAWCASGYSQKSVAEAFQCDSGMTSMIVNRKTWRHI